MDAQNQPPSTHDNVAVALAFASSLKETGLEIVTELHVFFNNKIIVEEWQVVGESDKTSAIPKEAFTSMSIRKVSVEDSDRACGVGRAAARRERVKY